MAGIDAEIEGLYPRLLAMARRYHRHDWAMAEDLAQDTVLRALTARRPYDGTRPLAAWCAAIMHNLYLSGLRHRSCVPMVPIVDRDEAGGEHADARLLTSEVLEAVERLSERSLCMDTLMDYASGYSLKEIAEMRGLPLGTVKRRIHEARKLLTALLEL